VETTTRNAAWSAEERERYVRLYRSMLVIRRFEEAVQALFLRGEVYGTTHLYSGQEAVAAGVSSVLDERDLARARLHRELRHRRRLDRRRRGRGTGAA
jgi:TPP-dependent pyruvate/acetoin dehydrogenase alpha subunit